MVKLSVEVYLGDNDDLCIQVQDLKFILTRSGPSNIVSSYTYECETNRHISDTRGKYITCDFVEVTCDYGSLLLYKHKDLVIFSAYNDQGVRVTGNKWRVLGEREDRDITYKYSKVKSARSVC